MILSETTFKPLKYTINGMIVEKIACNEKFFEKNLLILL